MKESIFLIAGFRVNVRLPYGWNVEVLLPSFLPFRCLSEEQGEKLLECTVYGGQNAPDAVSGTLLENTLSDMGNVSLYKEAEGYGISLSMESGRKSLMRADRCFSVVRMYVQEDDHQAGHALSSLLRIAYSQAVLRRNAVSIHASAVFCGGRAFLFLGKSGTGKSTHSTLWIRYIPGTELLNDDNPVIRIVNGRVYAYGTPWSGKKPCYKALAFPVGGIVRLKQAPLNRFSYQKEIDAFAAVLPGCSVIRQDEKLRSCLYDTLVCLAEMVKVGILECRPDREAALICRRALS